jgi:glycosyltransferase involved in cell wall biosynthesis
MYVSIIVTSYNYELYIERCIRSCLDQDFDPAKFEVIVVDDHSDDHTVAVLDKFKRFPNFRLIVNDRNVGVAEASNIGVRAALGRYVVRVDADDYIGEYMVKFMSHYLDMNPDAFCLACDYFRVDDKQKLERVHAEQSPISCGIMYRKDDLVAMGLYNPDFRHREEEELRSRLKYQAHFLRIPFYRYRIHNTNKTKSPDYLLTKVPQY